MADALGNFELMVMLAILRLDDDKAYAVPISAEIEQFTGRGAALATIYAALERLEAKGLVSSWIGEPTAARGGRAKRHFQVTAKGLRRVRETRRALTKLWTGVPRLQGGKA